MPHNYKLLNNYTPATHFIEAYSIGKEAECRNTDYNMIKHLPEYLEKTESTTSIKTVAVFLIHPNPTR